MKSTSSQFLRTLAHLPDFSQLTAATQEALAAHAIQRQFAAGEVIYLEGEPAEVIYVLESGWIKATRMTSEGREQALMFLRPVEIFGHIAAFSDTSYPGTVIALEDVKVWTIPALTVLSLLEAHPDLSLAIIRHLSNRVLHYINLVEDLALYRVEVRVARALLQNAESHDGMLMVPRREWATFDQMAVRLGTVRDVLSRALKSLESERLIKVEKQAILLLDPKGLAIRAER
jgi:CRP/FNR family transcriptional regulator